MHDDDMDWLDALAGRDASGEGSPATREAAGLRAGILSRSIPQGPPVPQTDVLREAELLNRARREGLLAHPAAAGAIHSEASIAGRLAGWIGGWRGLAAAAAVAMLAVVAALQWRQPPTAPEVPTV